MTFFNKIKAFTIMVVLFATHYSCTFLDVVPPEQAGLPDATQDAQATLGFLYSCYAGVNMSQNTSYTGLVNGAATDEYSLPLLWAHDGQSYSWGRITPAATGQWHWGNCYRFIGQCHLFLEQLENAVGVTEEQKKEWSAEANFLIAYYHFRILQLYGPCPLNVEYIDMDTPGSEFPGRSHFDYVTKWIVDKLTEVEKDLPATRVSDEWGRATSTIAKAIKASCLLEAASPLWNGKFPYTNWKNQNFETPGYGKELVSLSYSKEKWEKAKDACLEVLDFAKQSGHVLYEDTIRYRSEGLKLPFVPGKNERDHSEFLQRVMMFRYLVTTRSNDGNSEIIWGLANAGDIVAGSEPHRILKKNDNTWVGGYNGVGPTLNTVENFYTEDGKLPRHDQNFYNETEWFQSAGVTDRSDIIKLNMGREPRFYAWIGFDGGDYGGSKYVNGTSALKLEMRNGQRQGMNPSLYNRDHSPTGFMSQKFIQPAKGYTANGGVSGNESYPNQLIRMAELYLDVAECYAELGEVDNALLYLNEIRRRAGINELTAADISGEMTIVDWVRQERFIELWNEGKRFRDVRRWAEGSTYFGAGKRYGLNATQKVDPTFEEFNRRTPIAQPFIWNDYMYLLPLYVNEVYKNPNMVQAPGY